MGGRRPRARSPNQVTETGKKLPAVFTVAPSNAPAVHDRHQVSTAVQTSSNLQHSAGFREGLQNLIGQSLQSSPTPKGRNSENLGATNSSNSLGLALAGSDPRQTSLRTQQEFLRNVPKGRELRLRPRSGNLDDPFEQTTDGPIGMETLITQLKESVALLSEIIAHHNKTVEALMKDNQSVRGTVSFLTQMLLNRDAAATGNFQTDQDVNDGMATIESVVERTHGWEANLVSPRPCPSRRVGSVGLSPAALRRFELGVGEFGNGDSVVTESQVSHGTSRARDGKHPSNSDDEDDKAALSTQSTPSPADHSWLSPAALARFTAPWSPETPPVLHINHFRRGHENIHDGVGGVDEAEMASHTTSEALEGSMYSFSSEGPCSSSISWI
ncbi:hypothetical protein P152DRAFT_46489 [Eremomyces bilateralis CBS 781.70]|uniref:Uncharacterized protein n=1 Tax=Eremomyces bilateralis CBS 781.70 TaxID=1392243 RepID=A0A6G1G264_9PEZI|nr:uncharacterized protein P152DRAFT_46489 [Eremomyces bilateralis CBS 781.70]KAF1812108.1 hypothetical protein P152DRAFT_46489 [Eremomyces bilateralis CBS 781.70]